MQLNEQIHSYLLELYNSTGENFWVGERFKLSNGEFAWYTWQQVKDYLAGIPIVTTTGKEKLLEPNYRTVLKHEIVMESDLDIESNAKIAMRICKALKEKDYSFEDDFSGNKSHHIHIFFGEELAALTDFYRTKAKNLFVEQFPKDISDVIDRSNLTKKHMILIPGALHPKTNFPKKRIMWNRLGEINKFPEELIEQAIKIPEPKQDTSGLSYAPGKCLACEYALTNLIIQKEGLTRYENLSPNLAAYIRGKPNREELAKKYYTTQKKDGSTDPITGETNIKTSELECWDKKPSEFQCKQLNRYMNAIGLGNICDLCLLQGGYKEGVVKW